MMLLVILLSMSVIYSTLSAMRHQIHGDNCHLHLNINLNYVTVWIGARSGLLISMLEKLNLFDQSNNTGAIDMKMGAFVLEMLELIFSSKFDWGCYIFSNT